MDYFIATTSSDEQQYHIEMKEFIRTSTNDSIRVFLNDRMKRDLGIDYKVRLTNCWFPKSQKNKELGN